METPSTPPGRVATSSRPSTSACCLFLGSVLLAAAVVCPVRADDLPGVIETVVGGGNGDGHSSLSAVVDPRGLAVCPRGPGGRLDLYIADGKGNRVRRVDGVTGVVSTVAGTGVAGFTGDGGLATDAQLSFPLDVACDANGNTYLADGFSNRRVRKIDRAGYISTVAGNGQHDFSGDNVLATQAAMAPYALALDAAGNIYIADADNRRVRKVGLNGIITTVAGTGVYGYAHDGRPAAQEALGFPSGVAVDGTGRLYIADYNNKVIYRVTNGVIAVFAGDYVPAYGGDGGPATSAHLYLPNRVAVDPFGSVLIVDQGNNRVRRVDTAGVITTIAGDGTVSSAGDGGAGTRAGLFPLRAVASDPSGNVYIGSSVSGAEPWSYDNRVRMLDSSGTIDTLAGISDNGDGPSPADAVIDPHGLLTGRQPWFNDVYIADSRNNQVRKLDGVTGAVSTIAGTGEAGFSGDGGPATAARLSGPSDVTGDAAGNLYVVDQNNQRVRRISSRGIITTVAGSGAFGYNGDAVLAVSAALASPTGVAVDNSGNVYIADRYNYRIRLVTPQGIISTVAGNGTYNPQGSSGDGGPATQAQLGVPTGVVVAPDGSLYVAEFGTHRVRKIRTNGIIITIAGNGNYGAGGDGGLAVNAQLNGPFALALDVAGNLYIDDSANQRVRRIDVVSGLITTVAGNGNAGTQGDGGPATDANLYPPSGIGVDASGHLYIAQADSSRVRRVLLSTAPTLPVPTRTFTPTPSVGATRTPTPTASRTATRTATPTASPQPTQTARPTSPPSFTFTPTVAPTSIPTLQRTPTPFGTPSATPTLSLTVSGHIGYQRSGLEVHDATVQLSADVLPRDAAPAMMRAATDDAGEYALYGVSGGAWRIEPQKVGGVEDAINAVDAVYALQAAAGLRGFRADEQLACDVDADGQVSNADAEMMLQRAVGLVPRFPVALLCQSDWVFTPEPAAMAQQNLIAPTVSSGSCQPGAIVYRPLNSDATDQDFSARAFGDCSGDWQPATTAVRSGARSLAAPSQPVLRHFQRLRDRVRVSIYVQSPGTFHAVDVQLAYNPAVLSAPRVAQTRRVKAALMATNDQEPGLVAISLASAHPVRGGRVLTVDFTINVPGTRPAPASVIMLVGRVVQVQ